MRVKLFTFRYSHTLGGFDETPLRDFARDKTLLQFREHFFTVDQVPHLVCVAVYHEALVGAPRQSATLSAPDRREPAVRTNASPKAGGNADGTRRARRRRGRPDPTADLDERQRLLFNTLREWRTQTAHEEGVPAYVVFTDKQLVSIVQRVPDSLTALGTVDGIGEAKLRRHGTQVLRALHGARSTESAGGHEAEPRQPSERRPGPPSDTPRTPKPCESKVTA